MKNGFNSVAGVDSSTLEFLINPQFVMEEREEEEIRKRKEKKNFSILKEKSAVISITDSIPDFFKPKYKRIHGKKTPIVLKRIRF
ncbi:MAG: hypothetical protein UR28_C0037G0005 [Candidatus Peregrinibacteria bacterium GW2011_GWF2_33_10]|uniref:Uncharacterized protein n=3 Tax=Candidatus Nomuraibacteriota TaxID=1752729 RepID=A0A0G0DV40_9BACT|nr:MAG: hypothetical protein UR28_C0037G0005 [Candidatus Peregrinibacteria bacterium GW2011_GWF2_33_10]KKP72486.1 MAG: hypothetical protein UR70_C0007G0021 [Candidatus Nomurabacteria bacterium GW2011_GWB1_35_20]KKP75598.1 MAG: hypothetical protein UR72_C0004G0056 [Parcubacteria group bacterium GW2011_GWC1_35_21]KKP78339.1 MAG: hypothetical protein UR77_C0004G0054 [Candidatus Nomurabacteria bacterium GW2011_GWC2_35_35]KKP88674.1 MAG: hypothetical protein UR92_C0001G0053 [Candidatus Nomurabacteri